MNTWECHNGHRVQVLGEPQQCHCGSGKFKKVRG